MLRTLNHLIGYKMSAQDGEIGHAADFLFDEEQCTIRYLVVDTGNWLPGRKVLLAPESISTPDWDSKTIAAKLTKAQIESSPPLSDHEPISRDLESRIAQHFQWTPYFSMSMVGGAIPQAVPTETARLAEEATTNTLRSATEVMGYQISASDGEVGHVADFIGEDTDWTVRYFVVDTGNWLPGRKVLLSPSWIAAIQWADRKVTTDLNQEIIEASPTFDPHAPVNREYESSLFDYYGRPAYWLDR